MIILLAILITLEILTFLVLSEHFSNISKPRYYIILTINLVLSIWVWVLFVKNTTYRGPFDTPQNVASHMNLSLVIFAVLLPRFLLTLLHFTGKLFRIRRGGYSKFLTRSGIIISALIFLIAAWSSLFGRYNFRTEEAEVRIKGLDPKLEGLTIVQLSDMHLASFYRHHGKLSNVIREVNALNPDLIINTGDFVTYGWREFDRFDTILSKSAGRYGNLAVLGNHDMGTYLPDATDEERKDNHLRMKELVRASGFRLLDNEHIVLDIRGVKIEFIGIETSGHFPEMIHTDIKPAMQGGDTADFKIALIHDPNQWRKDICDKTDIELSLAGHTHGMQIGIITKNFRWSPAKFIYPEWNGLFRDGDQYLYVNRGLGVLGIPLRIWMPPEITLLRLTAA